MQKNTLAFIADIKKKSGVESDYAVAKILGITRVSMSSYRNGKSHFSDEIALRVADLLELDPAYVLACIHAERERNLEVKKTWETLAKRLATVAAVLAVVAFALPLSQDHQAGAILASIDDATGGTMYIMSNTVLVYWWIFLPLFLFWIWHFPRNNPAPKK